MISVERILNYGQLESEAPLETNFPHKKPPPNWPSKGEIEFNNVYFRYSEDLPLVVRSVSFSIKPGEKVRGFINW